MWPDLVVQVMFGSAQFVGATGYLVLCCGIGRTWRARPQSAVAPG